ncbi:MAG: MBL fold metallo-hydrolase [Ammonifex sp.]|jgi:L-ascorbate metabolism protein UlaG (beta-lactamase superfamily)|nr:MAG: MBL fold metallo-hydrolase [Ammonifex sp.]
MQIKWLGHACFYLVTQDGTKIVTDPYDEATGYRLPPVAPDVVTVSHHHHDHNAVGLLRGSPRVIDLAGTHVVQGLTIRGVATFHDKKKGAERGPNTVFVIEADGLKVCHLGDLGHYPDVEKLREIGPVDVLLIPVGGTYTIDAGEAAALVKDMKPRVAVPMHYKTKHLRISIAPVDNFLAHFEAVDYRQLLELTPADLPPATTVAVLERSES